MNVKFIFEDEKNAIIKFDEVIVKDFDQKLFDVKVLMLKGEKGDTGDPTQEQVDQAVDDYFEEHPEHVVPDDSVSTDKIQDWAITHDKLAVDAVPIDSSFSTNSGNALQNKVITSGKADIIIDEASGSIVSFPDGAALPADSFVVNIDLVQDLHGYDHPWPAGGGKNLVDAESPQTITSQTELARYATSEQTTFTVSATIKNNASFVGTLKIMLYNGKSFIREVTVNVPSLASAARYSCTVDCSNTVYDNMRLVISGQSVGYSLTVSDVQLEKGSTATSYTPYSNICPISGRTGLSVYVSPTQDQQDATTYAVDWTTEAGTVYGGTLDVLSGLLTVDWAIVDLGTLAWGYRLSGSPVAPYFYANYSGKIAYPGALFTYPIDAVCSQYKIVVRNGATFVYYTLSCDGGSSVEQIQVKDPRYTDAATFKTAMSGVQLCYKLATPVTYQLTPQEVLTLVGANNVWSDTGDIIVRYRVDTKLYIDKKLAELQALILES